MKKALAAIVAAVLLFLPAAAVHSNYNDTRKVWMNKDEFSMCFDVIYFDGPDGRKSQKDVFGVSEGSANKVIDEHPIYLTEETTAILCYGWAGIKEDGPYIAVYGYRINEGPSVLDSSFTKGAEQAVYNAGGDSRFLISVPIKTYDEPTLITLVARGSDGVVRDMIEFSVNGEYVSLKDLPDITPEERTFEETDESKLNLVITGGTEPNPVLKDSEFTAEIKLENNDAATGADLFIHYDPGLTYVSSSFPVPSAEATDDPATHTLRVTWNSANDIKDDFVIAEIVFRTGANLHDGEFLHVSADKEQSSVSYKGKKAALNIINGGADIIPFYLGDVDGDSELTNKDVVLIFRCSSETEFELPYDTADVNKDGEINNKDVVMLFRSVSTNDVSMLIPDMTPPSYGETTETVNNIRSWTFDDGTAGSVIGLYCETEPDAEVLVCDKIGNVLLREKSLYGRFFGRFIMPEGKTSLDVYIYARSEGKALSHSSRPYTLAYGDSVGSGAIIGKDSHVYLNWYKDFYLGQQSLNGEQLTGRMNNIKKKLYDKLAEVRSRTGKNTKIIILVCTNPATVYHDLQYGQEEKGWGDCDMPTATTQLGEFLSGDENVYMLDMRQILSEHKNQLLFMQADSHWTQIGAYYGYYLTANRIKQDFPTLPVYDLENDFETAVAAGGGDLLGFMGASGVTAVSAYVAPKYDYMSSPSGKPTAYVMGDSYMGAFYGFLPLLFSDVYYNMFDDHPNRPLYDYILDDLESKKPDYLFYIWTERNIDAAMSKLESRIIGEARS